MKTKELSSILVVGAILFIAPRPSSAQTNDFKSQYEDFKKQARVEYEDFRAQCNAEYAEFVKEAWKEYKALPAIPRPKDEIVSPIIRPNKDKGGQGYNHQGYCLTNRTNSTTNAYLSYL